MAVVVLLRVQCRSARRRNLLISDIDTADILDDARWIHSASELSPKASNEACFAYCSLHDHSIEPVRSRSLAALETRERMRVGFFGMPWAVNLVEVRASHGDISDESDLPTGGSCELK